MKKLFFFKSSASSSGNNNNATLPKSTNKQKAWDSVSMIGTNNQAYDLRRSRSLSSSACQFRDPTRSPSSSIVSDPYHQFEHSSRCQATNYEKQKRDTTAQVSSVQNSHGYERPGSTSSSRSHHESSGNSFQQHFKLVTHLTIFFCKQLFAHILRLVTHLTISSICKQLFGHILRVMLILHY